MPFIVDVQTQYPNNYYSQEDIAENIINLWKDKVRNTNRIKAIYENVQVKSRHLAMPLEEYFNELNFDQRNSRFIETAVDLAENAINKLLEKYDLPPSMVKSLWSNTVTGFAIPSLDARVMNRIDFAPNTKRIPLLGLGCMAGVAGINRVADYLKGHPQEAAIFFSVELCSLTVQMQDISVANLISTGLFGDGSAAVLMVGDEHPLAKVAKLEHLSSESIFFPDSEDVMGWQVGEKGLKIILSKSVPEVTETQLVEPLANFLKSNNLQIKNFKTFFAHPGGPKVMLALEKVLGLPGRGLIDSWESLEENGNMSSVSVLDIFSRIFNKKNHKPGDLALSVAMGPAFSAELGLLKWK